MQRQSDGLRLVFPFGEPVPAAVFRRADTLWLVFDTDARLDLERLNTDRLLRNVTQSLSGQARVLRVKLERPLLVSMAAEGSTWTVTIGEAIKDIGQPLASLAVISPRFPENTGQSGQADAKVSAALRRLAPVERCA